MHYASNVLEFRRKMLSIFYRSFYSQSSVLIRLLRSVNLGPLRFSRDPPRYPSHRIRRDNPWEPSDSIWRIRQIGLYKASFPQQNRSPHFVSLASLLVPCAPPCSSPS